MTRRHIYVAEATGPDGTLIDVMLNIYEPTTAADLPGLQADVALRDPSSRSWLPPAALTSAGVDS